jgi:hypothetical protein
MKLSDKEQKEIIKAAQDLLSNSNKLKEFLNQSMKNSPFSNMGDSIGMTQKSVCDHGVIFDEEDAKKLNEVSKIRKKYPRGFGPCPKGCGYDGIAYASYLHYIMGDW